MLEHLKVPPGFFRRSWEWIMDPGEDGQYWRSYFLLTGIFVTGFFCVPPVTLARAYGATGWPAFAWLLPIVVGWLCARKVVDPTVYPAD